MLTARPPSELLALLTPLLVLTSLLALFLALTLLRPALWLPRVMSILLFTLRFPLRAFRPWRLRLIVDHHRLRTLDCRAARLRRGRCGGCPLNAFAPLPLLRRLWACGGWSNLLRRRWRAGTLVRLRPTLPRLRLRSLLLLLLKVLPHVGVLRLIAVLVPFQCLLLLYSGISIP